jgi:hypothetical protein
MTITKYRKFHENVTFKTQRFMDFWPTLRVFAGKEAYTAFSPRPFDSKRNINAPKNCQMAVKWESFPDESFKYKLSASTVQQHMHWTFLYLGSALSAPIFYYSHILDVCDCNATEIILILF